VLLEAHAQHLNHLHQRHLDSLHGLADSVTVPVAARASEATEERSGQRHRAACQYLAAGGHDVLSARAARRRYRPRGTLSCKLVFDACRHRLCLSRWGSGRGWGPGRILPVPVPPCGGWRRNFPVRVLGVVIGTAVIKISHRHLPTIAPAVPLSTSQEIERDVWVTLMERRPNFAALNRRLPLRMVRRHPGRRSRPDDFVDVRSRCRSALRGASLRSR
jgi:hypothetical protein